MLSLWVLLFTLWCGFLCPTEQPPSPREELALLATAEDFLLQCWLPGPVEGWNWGNHSVCSMRYQTLLAKNFPLPTWSHDILCYRWPAREFDCSFASSPLGALFDMDDWWEEGEAYIQRAIREGIRDLKEAREEELCDKNRQIAQLQELFREGYSYVSSNGEGELYEIAFGRMSGTPIQEEIELLQKEIRGTEGQIEAYDAYLDYVREIFSSIESSREKRASIQQEYPLLYGTRTWSGEVRSWHKMVTDFIADPIDVITGAFFSEEVDLVLLGTFPIKISRHYNSQNPLKTSLGYGWKSNIQPYLIRQGDLIFAIEGDGTVLAYRYNPRSSRWEVFPEDNPQVTRHPNCATNLFDSYIEKGVLHGSDGSLRIFDGYWLRTWIDARGSSAKFSYNVHGLVSRIQNSNGDFCEFFYNNDDDEDDTREEYLLAISTNDGRWISYGYSPSGDLTRVTAPNGACSTYTYDIEHRILSRKDPDGHLIENVYDAQGRVVQQRSQKITTASLSYGKEKTLVTDPNGHCTTYEIFQNQIHTITDPLGNTTLFSWFLDAHTLFDPKEKRPIPWAQEGGFVRSLHSTMDPRGLVTTYWYDKKGNVSRQVLEGEDCPRQEKEYLYDALSRCKEERIGLQKTISSYDKTFPRLLKKWEKYVEGTLVSSKEWTYNALGQLEKEDLDGAVTLWQYNNRGLPSTSTQKTHTEDPDVAVFYEYDAIGNCTQISSATGIEKRSYDSVGNLCTKKTFSPQGKLLFSMEIEYTLGAKPLIERTLCGEKHFSYDGSGNLLSWEIEGKTHTYSYDIQGNLVTEEDPQQHQTKRTYDPMGRVVSIEREGILSRFSYEKGGLLQSTTSPLGHTTTREYTSNGLLRNISFPDGTTHTLSYDNFGRLTQKEALGRIQHILYDDKTLQKITQEDLLQEIFQFDARGNILTYTDAAGYTYTYTYDGLNRIKTSTTPLGYTTTWQYVGDTTICKTPDGVSTHTRREGDQIVEEFSLNEQGECISRREISYDPLTSTETHLQGDTRTKIHLNAVGLPLSLEKGGERIEYRYDPCGNLVEKIEGNGESTRQVFDAHHQIVEKTLPDNSQIHYEYDPEANLIACHLPNNTTWLASYDSMGRIVQEKLLSAGQSTLETTYSYENGHLLEKKDPHLHTYQYDTRGNLVEERVGTSSRTYTYDERNLLLFAEETKEQELSWLNSWFYPSQERTHIERSYDADRRIRAEKTYRNGSLLHEVQQTWTPTTKTLFINNTPLCAHTYEGNRLLQTQTSHCAISYVYDLAGNLLEKKTPHSHVCLTYKENGLPTHKALSLANTLLEESLSWDLNGKPASYQTPQGHHTITYTQRGQLATFGNTFFQYDQGYLGTGICSASKDRYVPPEGMDPFGRVTLEYLANIPVATLYNEKGEVVVRGEQKLQWDPWGRLIQVTENTTQWNALYDPLGRRIQTFYSSINDTHCTSSVYDPEKEFREIAITIDGNTFGKIYGPQTCDALTDSSGRVLFLEHNLFGQQIARHLGQEAWVSSPSPPYGPTENTQYPSNLASYAETLSWHSQALDPTRLFWFGKRYYDPRCGRFLSPDPLGYPLCLDLYAYAGGDPLCYHDLDGRFLSPIYASIQPSLLEIGTTMLDIWADPRFQGLLQTIGGLGEVSFGASMTIASGGLGVPLGGITTAHGMDHFWTGLQTLLSGNPKNSMTHQLLRNMGGSEQLSRWIDTGIGLSASSGLAMLSRGMKIGSQGSRSAEGIMGRLGWEIKYPYYQDVNHHTTTTIRNRLYSGHALDQMQNRGFVPSVVENAINNGKVFSNKSGTIGYYDSVNNVRVFVNSGNGTVVTVIPGAPR